MRPKASTLFPLFRSQAQATVLAALYLSSDALSVAALARKAAITPQALGKWLPDLELAGIITADRSDKRVTFSANTTTPFYPALRALLEVTCGAPVVLSDELQTVEGITEVFIFGSWAARATAVDGPMPGDIDVLLVGSPDMGAVASALDRASARLRRPVNPLVATEAEWAQKQLPLLAVLAAAPLVSVPHERRSKHVEPDDGSSRNRASGGDWESAVLADLG